MDYWVETMTDKGGIWLVGRIGQSVGTGWAYGL